VPYSEILAEHHRLSMPVYLEVNPDNRMITALLIPMPGKVVAFSGDSSGNITFRLDNSATKFVFPRSHPDYHDWARILREAQFDGSTVLVTETELPPEIVDIRLAENPTEPALPSAPALPPPVGSVTSDRAMGLFELASSQSCLPLDPVAPCIPFLYPRNGCHARAHEMCRLFLAAGVQPAKIWNYCVDMKNPLVVKTPNAPTCQVEWVFHVAPTLQVQISGRPGTQTMVLDPSLFPKGPVTPAEWHGVQGAPDSILVFTSMDPFQPPVPHGIITDPTYVRTIHQLAIYRGKFKVMVAKAGPPPYKNCPGSS
jgi:hypothetical protein